MGYEHKLNSGSIVKNDYKQADKHPDYKGQINVEGKLFDIALWVKEGNNGKKFFSAALSEPYVKPEQEQSQPQSNSFSDDVDESIPF